MKPEAKFRTNQVTPFLKSLRKTAYFPIQQKAIRGDADFFLVVNGRFVWLELKAPNGREEALQKFKREQAMAAGAIAFVAKPENWPQIKKYLKLLSEGEEYEFHR